MTKNTRGPKPFDHYDLNGDEIEYSEAERALRGFINRVEKDLPIPKELLSFIAKGLRKQCATGKTQNWTGKKSGRPEAPAYDYLNMLAWYRFYLDPNFNHFPKTTGEGRHYFIAESFKDPDLQVQLAGVLSDKVDGIKGMSSESSIKRAVNKFQKFGLLAEETNWPTKRHNKIQTEIFCARILRLPNEHLDAHCCKIIECWNKNNKVQE